MVRSTAIVQVERLRDQVYRLIRADMESGEFAPGERILEGALAMRYGVSRTPVREALFQLSREGLVSSATGRGVIVAVDTQTLTRHRHQVRDLIDPAMAWHAAREGTAAQKRALAKIHVRQMAADRAGQIDAFIEANAAFRATVRAMCGNESLAACSAMIDDQAQQTRRIVFVTEANRRLELDFADRLNAAIQAGNASEAKTCMHEYIVTVGLQDWLDRPIMS